MIEPATANGAPASASAPIAAASAPRYGPNRIATGSVATRPSSSGVTVVSGSRFSARPRTPAATAIAVRRARTAWDTGVGKELSNCAAVASFPQVILPAPHAGVDSRRRPRHRRDPRPHASTLELHDDRGGERRPGLGTAEVGGRPDAGHPRLDDARDGRSRRLPEGPRGAAARDRK